MRKLIVLFPILALAGVIFSSNEVFTSPFVDAYAYIVDEGDGIIHKGKGFATGSAFIEVRTKGFGYKPGEGWVQRAYKYNSGVGVVWANTRFVFYNRSTYTQVATECTANWGVATETDWVSQPL